MEIRKNEPMRNHTTFRTGGEADWFLLPDTAEEFQAVVRRLNLDGVPWYVLGNGSNLLVSDRGIRGVVISTEKLNRLERDGRILRAGAGVLLSKAAAMACREGLGGLEFAAGIPGTVGGAAVMNAGAYGSEMKDVLETVTALDKEGTIRLFRAEELELGYRTSRIMREGCLVLEASYLLNPGETEEIRNRMDELAARRKEKQPLEYPSAGSTFKRPEGYFAGKLIEDAGLKGFSVGGAQVSEKHAGFVINRDHAAASDIYRLCQEVKRRVMEQTGVSLEMEVRLWGDFEGLTSDKGG